MQVYSDPARENVATALPDVEVFEVSAHEFMTAESGSAYAEMMANAVDGTDGSIVSFKQAAHDLAGWYYWSCLPGCLPDGDPSGPYETREAAIAACQDN